MDPNAVLVWVQLGSELVRIGTAGLAKVRQSLDSTDETGNQILDEKIADYDRRIAERKKDATGVDTPTE